MEYQKIENRYIILEDLVTLLKTKFGENNYNITEHNNFYEIEVSVKLSDRNRVNPEKISWLQKLSIKPVARSAGTMEGLLKSIKNIRTANKNYESRHFIPETALFAVFTEPAIKLSLKDLGIPTHEIKVLTDAILLGARKCFAILILIQCGQNISNFIKYDSLQQSNPDDRLPYTREALQRIFGDQDITFSVNDFLEKQWEFAIPIMRQQLINRQLETEVILPFLHEEPAGRGAMGIAWKVEIHPQCHRLPITNHKIIRKQIEFEKGAVFEKELKNLQLLSYLDHPNIIQLYCSYIYRQKYNFIFAVANGGSLEDFLDREKGTRGPEGSQLLLALVGLADAINKMHNFTAGVLELTLSGCHHDLAPRNILVHDKTLMLADFGLSTFRDAIEDSLTTFKETRSSYIAPECQTFRGDQPQTEKIGRASDVWSFGCILLELLTHMLMSSDGVEQFRSKRKFQVAPGITWYRFHRGPKTQCVEVQVWLEKLQQKNEEPYIVRLLCLIRKMLSIDPKLRPSSAEVLTALRGVFILSIASSIKLDNTNESIDRRLGHMRFQSWLIAFNRLLDESDQSKPGNFEYDFSMIAQALKDVHRIIESSLEVPIYDKGQQQSLLRYQHARLTESLPSDYRLIAKAYLENQVLQLDTKDLGKLTTAITEAGDEDIGVLIAVKHLTALADAGRLTEQENLVLDLGDIALQDQINIHNLAFLRPKSERVLVEWLMYDEKWTHKLIGTELRTRLASVVGLLHAESTTQIPGSMHCKGFFHDPSNRAFGVVHSIPLLSGRPITMHGLLQKGKSYCPLLEDRFSLAFEICECIYTFHKVGWLHRNIHSMNVLFFPQEGAGEVECAKEPRILGFAKSRENRLDSFSVGPAFNKELEGYQHPEYRASQQRYREDFDYYSVGILLLEIGFWKTLSKMTNSDHFREISDVVFRKRIIESRVPHLGVVMGTRYMEATRVCLEGDFAGGSGGLTDNCYMSFKRLVMDRIQLIK